MNDIDPPTLPKRRASFAGYERLLGLDGNSTQSSPVSDDAGMNNAVLYLRVSTTRQMNTASDIDADGNSIATQRQDSLERARKLGAPVLREFVEPGNSAQSIAKRPVFRELLRFVEDHPEIRYVIIYMRSRVFRNQTDAAITKRILGQMGVKLVSTKEDFGEGYMSDAMEAITDIMNEVVVRQSGEDIKVKMRHKAENGGTIGRAKLGYLNVRKDFDGRLVNTIDIDPERAPLVKWAFEAYATGEYTVTQLGESLAEQGLTSRPSARWKAQRISISQLSVILHDPYYVGVVRYKGQLFPGRHQALITNELFQRVQDVLSERARRGQRDRVHHHMLKGLLYCDRCREGEQRSRVIFTEIVGNGGLYEYFMCRGRQDRRCDLGSLPVNEVEAAVERAFVAHAIPDDFVRLMRDEIANLLLDTQEADRETRARLNKQLAKLEVQEQRLLDLAADAELNGANLRERLRKVAIERGSIREKLERTDNLIERGAASLMIYLDLLSQPAEIYRRSPDNVKRQLLEAFFEELWVDEGTDSIDVRAVARPAVLHLHEAANELHARRQHQAAPTTETRKNPGPTTGATAFLTSAGSLTGFFDALGFSKTALVGLLKNYWKQSRRTAQLEQLLIEARSNVGTQRLRRRAPTRNELPAEVVQAMIREYRRGASTYQLAAWHNVRRNTVRYVLRRNGVQMAEGTTAKLSPAQKDAVRLKRADGATLRVLCAEFQVSESTIKRTLKRGP